MKKLIAVLSLILFTPLAYAGWYYSAGISGGSYVQDSFTNSDSTALATHDPNWTSIDATYTVDNFEINSNQCEVTATYTRAGAYYDSTSGVPPTNAVDYVSGDSWDNSDYTSCMNIGVRMSSGSRGYAVKLGVESGGNWTRLTLYKNGSEVTYGSVSIPANQQNTIYVKAENSGADVIVSAWVNDPSGAADVTTTDTTDTITSGWGGFYNSASSSFIPTMDNYDETPF